MANASLQEFFDQTENGNLNNKIRVVGAGNTAITFGDKLVILCKSVRDDAPRLMSNPAKIQGIGDQRPVAIVPSNVQDAGTLTLEFWEKYPTQADGFYFWQQALKHCFPDSEYNLGGITNIAALMSYQRTNPKFAENFTVSMFIENPTYDSSGNRVASSDVTVKRFMNPVITDVEGNENITNESIVKTGTMKIMYTHPIINSMPSGLSVVSLKG